MSDVTNYEFLMLDLKLLLKHANIPSYLGAFAFILERWSLGHHRTRDTTVTSWTMQVLQVIRIVSLRTST